MGQKPIWVHFFHCYLYHWIRSLRFFKMSYLRYVLHYLTLISKSDWECLLVTIILFESRFWCILCALYHKVLSKMWKKFIVCLKTFLWCWVIPLGYTMSIIFPAKNIFGTSLKWRQGQNIPKYGQKCQKSW